MGEDAGNRGSGCREKRVERLKRGMARRLSCQIGGVIADPFKTFLFVKRGLVIAISFSMGFDHAEHRVALDRARAGVGHRLGNVVRRRRSEAETAGADHAANCSDREESAPRRIHGREHRTFDCHDCALRSAICASSVRDLIQC